MRTRSIRSARLTTSVLRRLACDATSVLLSCHASRVCIEAKSWLLDFTSHHRASVVDERNQNFLDLTVVGRRLCASVDLVGDQHGTSMWIITTRSRPMRWLLPSSSAKRMHARQGCSSFSRHRCRFLSHGPFGYVLTSPHHMLLVLKFVAFIRALEPR